MCIVSAFALRAKEKRTLVFVVRAGTNYAQHSALYDM